MDKFFPLYIIVTSINCIPLNIAEKMYYFIAFNGFDGLVETEDWAVSQKSYFYLMNEEVPIWHKRDMSTDPSDDGTSYYEILKARRFPDIEESEYEIPNASSDTDDPYVCIECSINYTTNEASINNIANKPACGFKSLDMIFYMCFRLFDSLRFEGSVFIMDVGHKDGHLISFFIMKKYPNDAIHFSKYQDYDFQVQPNSIPMLQNIKHKVTHGQLTETDLETSVDLMMGLARMENHNYRRTMQRLSPKFVGGRTRRKRCGRRRKTMRKK